MDFITSDSLTFGRAGSIGCAPIVGLQAIFILRSRNCKYKTSTIRNAIRKDTHRLHRCSGNRTAPKVAAFPLA